jgi:DNA-binding NarL/FixJ family response regulator
MLSKDGRVRETLGDVSVGIGESPVPSNDSEAPGPTPHQLDELRRGYATVERTLESIGAPAFLVNAAGLTQHMNAAGRGLLARDAVALAASLAVAVASRRPAPEWSLTRLTTPAGPGLVLAISRAGAPPPPTSEPLRAARVRWKLTARQAQVLQLVARGLTNALIAETLGISEGTVEYHLTALFDKAGVCNRATLIVQLLEISRPR